VVSHGREADVNVVTRSGRDTSSAGPVRSGAIGTPTVATQSTVEGDTVDDLSRGEHVNADVATDIDVDPNVSSAERESLVKEQTDDSTLRACWKLWERGKGNFEVVNGVLEKRQTPGTRHQTNCVATRTQRSRSRDGTWFMWRTHGLAEYGESHSLEFLVANVQSGRDTVGIEVRRLPT
jgi:hypothetical protein